MKGFLRRQEDGRLKDVSNFIFPDNILNNIIFINEQFGYYKLRYDAFCDDDGKEYNYLSDSDSDNGEYLVDGKPYPGFIEFYYIFNKIYNQIKKDDNDDCDSDIDCVIDFDFDFDIDCDVSENVSENVSDSESEDDSDYDF